MKRFLGIFFVLMFLLCGCASKESLKPKTESLSFGLNVSYDGEKYSFDVKTFKNGELECAVNSPETLGGMRIVVRGDDAIIDYKGIKIKKKLSDIPFGNAVSLFSAALKDASEKPALNVDGKNIVSGNVSGIDYVMEITKAGLPVTLDFRQEKIFFEFVKLTLVND